MTILCAYIINLYPIAFRCLPALFYSTPFHLGSLLLSNRSPIEILFLVFLVGSKSTEDNLSTIDLVKGNSNHRVTKHIRPKYHFTREAVNEGEVRIVHKSTDDMVADMLTKPLGRDKHTQFTSAILNL